MIIIDPGHGYRVTRDDPGAVFDLDGDGAFEMVEQERHLARLIAAYAHIALVLARVDSMVLGWGGYPWRASVAKQVDDAAPVDWCDVVQVHVNVGGGTYGLVGYVTQQSEARAEAIAAELRTLSEYTGGVRVDEATAATWPRIRACLEPYRSDTMRAVLVETGFGDAPAHRSLFAGDGPERLGRAIAAGLVARLA